MPFELIMTNKGEWTMNDVGDILILDTDTKSTMWVPQNQVLEIDENSENCNPDIEPYVEERCEGGNKEEKMWTENTILALIDLFKEHEQMFDSTIKKNVWAKIALSMNHLFNTKEFTSSNVETKWKGLKRTFKTIKIKNETSGNRRHSWPYYNAINEIIGKKPEITPPAVCSSQKGLMVVKSNKNIGEEPQTEPQPSTSSQPQDEIQPSTSSQTAPDPYQSTFSKKRKSVSSLNNRHQEKMQRQDRFLSLFEQMIEKM